MKALSLAEKSRTEVLRINEIFHSIQGESTRAGERSVFVRVTGCGLRCSYCDTEYAFFEGVELSISEIVHAVAGYDCQLVELTGGEPLEQAGIYTLMSELLARDYDVMIETGGHVDISRVDLRVKRIMDLKTPSSLMDGRNRYANVAHLTRHDEVKFVIGSEEDYVWSLEKVRELGLAERVGAVLFSPVHEAGLEAQLADWILRDSAPVRFQTQLHKVIWPSIVRGV